MKRVIMILFMLILVGMFSVSVAEETLEEGTMVVSGVVEEDIDNDFLFNMYAESLFGYGAPSFYRANHNFSEDMQEFYDFLVTCIKEVAAECEVPENQIKQWVREERLEFSKGSGALSCEQCGEPISTGRFCDKCKATMTNNLNASVAPGIQARRQAAMDAAAKELKNKGGMRFIKN